MNDAPRPTVLRELVSEVFGDDDRLTRGEIQQRAADLDLPAPLRTPVDALPDGTYEPRQAYQVLAEIQREEGVWRDEERVPLDDLTRAVATSGQEGQFDDPTGNEAGPGERYGEQLSEEPEAPAGGTPPRPSPEGRSGPH